MKNKIFKILLIIISSVLIFLGQMDDYYKPAVTKYGVRNEIMLIAYIGGLIILPIVILFVNMRKKTQN